MGNRAECAAKATKTEDGVRISGHNPIALLAFQDRDSERWYYIDRCDNCGHTTVAFSDNARPPKIEPREGSYYPEIAKVGGSNETL